MASGDTEEKTTAPVAAPIGGGNTKMPMILGVVNLVATLAMVGLIFVTFQKEKKKQSAEDIVATTEHGGGEAAGGAGEKKAEGGHGEKKGEAPKKKVGDFGKMITLEQFTVNLSTPGSVNPKYVRVNISLEVPGDEAEAEVTAKMPQVRNVVIDLFNSKKPADLATAEGRENLKEEIKNALNSFMMTGKVRGVFFTNFTVSS